MSGHRQTNGNMDNLHPTSTTMDESNQQQQQNARPTPMIGNINSPSVSLASVSSDGSGESSSHVVEPEEIVVLTSEVRRLKEAMGRLKKIFHHYPTTTMIHDVDSRSEATRVASHERLGEVLKILRQMLEKYPFLQSEELVRSAGNLIDQVKYFDYEAEHVDPKEFHEALDSLALAVSSRVSEYITGDLESVSASSTTTTTTTSSSKANKCEDYLASGGGARPKAETVVTATTTIESSRRHGSGGETDLDLVVGVADEMLTSDQIDAILMRHDQGVDHVLMRAKTWAKYAKDVITYVDKRTSMELDLARNLTKLAQTMRPVLKEESYLPFQSIYCTALDQDLEMCASTQATCSLLQGYKFMEPLAARRAEHEKTRKSLKDRWQKELKRIQEAVTNLKKAKALHMQRQQEYERCREALRIAEQGAEIGATGENKVDKRKRLEEEALQKTVESESLYRSCVVEANERHRNLLLVKQDVIVQSRELILQCDQTMKAVTVAYFQLQHTMTAPVPIQFQTLCESSRLYEPGSQFMEYVKRMPEPQSVRSVMTDPFTFEPYSQVEEDSVTRYSKTSTTSSVASNRRGPSYSVDFGGSEEGHTQGLYIKRKDILGPMLAWPPSISMGPGGQQQQQQQVVDPSDTESVDSTKSSPTASPLVTSKTTAAAAATKTAESYFDCSDHEKDSKAHHVPEKEKESSSKQQLPFPAEKEMMKHEVLKQKHEVPSSSRGGIERDMDSGKGGPTSPTTPPRRTVMSKAAVTHHFRKLKTFSKCRECDSYVYWQGYECADCGLSAHKKCLETLALQCGHRRLPRKMNTFGVDLSAHLAETNAQVPPLVIKCVQEIHTRGLKTQGIYRVSSVKHKMEKLCQAFENGAELVDLSDIPPHVIANVLKLYMRQLPEPLLTYGLYQDFVKVAENCPAANNSCVVNDNNNATTPSSEAVARPPFTAPLASEESSGSPTTPVVVAVSEAENNTSNATNEVVVEKEDNTTTSDNDNEDEMNAVDHLRELCRRLPKSHLFSLGFLMHHLAKVAAEAEVNNMPASNLAIVFGPTLLRSSENPGLASVSETMHQARVIELLTLNVTSIFGPPESVIPRNYARYTTTNIHHGKVRGRYSASGSSGMTAARSSRESGDLICSQTERRGEVRLDDFSLPGLVSSSSERMMMMTGSNEDIFGASVSDDDDDPDPIPPFLLPDGSAKSKKSPLLYRTSSPPKIIKQSLRNFSGLEGVTPERLSTQDSLEVAQRSSSLGQTPQQPVSQASMTLSSSKPAMARRSVHQEMSMPAAVASSTEAATVFHKMGRAAKKNSLDEGFFTTALPVTHENNSSSASEYSSVDLKTNLASLTIGIGNNAASATNSARSGSLSEDATAAGDKELKTKKSASSTSDVTQAGAAATILNIEENRVKIQVPGKQQLQQQHSGGSGSGSTRQHHAPVVKQSSIDKDDA